MKLWQKITLFNPITVIWTMALFMKIFNLTVSNTTWYGLPLFFTVSVMLVVSSIYMVYLFTDEFADV